MRTAMALRSTIDETSGMSSTFERWWMLIMCPSQVLACVHQTKCAQQFKRDVAGLRSSDLKSASRRQRNPT